MDGKEFPRGISFKRPHEKAPEFVKGRISIKVEEFIPYLKESVKNGWVNLDLKKSKKGNLYFELDTWEPGGDKPRPPSVQEQFEDDIPF